MPIGSACEPDARATTDVSQWISAMHAQARGVSWSLGLICRMTAWSWVDGRPTTPVGLGLHRNVPQRRCTAQESRPMGSGARPGAYRLRGASTGSQTSHDPSSPLPVFLVTTPGLRAPPPPPLPSLLDAAAACAPPVSQQTAPGPPGSLSLSVTTSLAAPNANQPRRPHLIITLSSSLPTSHPLRLHRLWPA